MCNRPDYKLQHNLMVDKRVGKLVGEEEVVVEEVVVEEGVVEVVVVKEKEEEEVVLEVLSMRDHCSLLMELVS